MTELPDIRIGTAEREQALTALGEHFAAGRLTVAEFEERSALISAATTRNELTLVFQDLPSSTAATLPAPAHTRKFDPDWSGRLIAVIPILAGILFFMTGTWLWFLAIPVAGALSFGTDKERKKRRRDDRNS